MTFDYIEIVKRLGKDKICLDYLELDTVRASGWVEYSLRKKSKIVLCLRQSTNELKVRANLPYYLQGHNFNFSKEKLIDGIQEISELLNINLFNAEASTFEFGTVMNIQCNPQEFLFNHIITDQYIINYNHTF